MLQSHVEVHVEAILKAHCGVVKHLELFVVRSGTFVCTVELVHAVTTATESLDHEHPELIVHQLEAAEEIKRAIVFLLLIQLLCV